MQTEKDKMLVGELYNPLDKQLIEERIQTRLLPKSLNESREDEPKERARIVAHLIPNKVIRTLMSDE